MYPCHIQRVAIDYPYSPQGVYPRRNYSPARMVLSDDLWQMKIDAPEWANIESSKLMRLPMTHTNIS